MKARGTEKAFTLIELIIVMALLTVAIGLAAPRLASFFRGRALDSEARRLLAFTRHAQERAASEGMPMRVWFDAAGGRFGIEPGGGFQQAQPGISLQTRETQVDPAIRIEVTTSVQNRSIGGLSSSRRTENRGSKYSGLPAIEFLADGSISENAPERITLRDADDYIRVLAQSRNRLGYELQP